MKIKPWCSKHSVNLENVGNGSMLFPTYGEPLLDNEGFMMIDLSEFSCPWGGEDGNDCTETWEIIVKSKF